MTTAALVALALAAAPPRAPAVPLPGTVSLPDGLELVVLPLPGATWSSLRLVVRAGGASDPHGHGGLAHLVEHLALEGSHDEDGRRLADDARQAGARLNAHTTPDLTKYELDAPAETFPALAERLLRIVTSPAWERAGIAAERGVIETEMGFHGAEGLLSLVDRAVFPAPVQAGPLGGSAESRADLDLDDVASFFATRYLPSNLTIVFAGAVSLDEARALVDRSFRIPPARPGEAPPRTDDEPLLPIEQKIPGWITVTMHGYALSPADRASCEAIATLAELRLVLAAQVDGPMARGVFVTCPVLRGTPFLVAAVYATKLDAGDLPRALEETFAGIGATPPSAAERAAVNARLDAQERRMLADPEALAERAAALVADRGDARPLAARLPLAPLPDAAALRRTAARSLTKDRRIVVHVSPLQE